MRQRLQVTNQIKNIGAMFVILLCVIAGESSIASAAVRVVTNTNDAGPGSLRETMALAANGDVINFSLPGCPCVIRLSSSLENIGKDLTIINTGLYLELNGNAGIGWPVSRRAVFENRGGSVYIEGIAFANASGAHGHGLWNSNGLMTLKHVVVHSNVAEGTAGVLDPEGAGAGIYNSGGNLVLLNSFVYNNHASGVGGGIANTGTMFVANTTISSNSSIGDGGGVNSGGGFAPGATLTIVNTTIVGNRNRTPCSGICFLRTSGLYITSSNATLNNSIIAGNYVDNLGNTFTDINNGFGSSPFGVANNNIIGTAEFTSIQDGVNGNIVGIGGVGTRPLDSIIEPFLGPNGGRVGTYALAHQNFSGARIESL